MLADHEAVRVNLRRDETFWDLRAVHCGAVAWTTRINRLGQGVLLAVSRELVRMDASAETEVAPVEPDLPLPVSPWESLPPLQVPAAATRWYGDEMVHLLASWFWQSLIVAALRKCCGSHTSSSTWTSCSQLVIRALFIVANG